MGAGALPVDRRPGFTPRERRHGHRPLAAPRRGAAAPALAGGLVGSPAAWAQPVTFADVSPLFAKYCVECHQPDGAAPFSLLTYRSARSHASQIADALERGIMPPWKASPDDGEFAGQRRPNRSEIDLVRRWVTEGAREGRPIGPAPPGPARRGWRLGTPDLVVTPAEPYVLPADGTDVFRIFVIPVPGDFTRYVRGLEFRPGNPRVVHHANIRIDRTAASRERDEADPAPGYDGLLSRTALFPSGHFLGWTPGQVPPLLPEGLAWPLEPGSDLVVQLHMQPSGKREAVQPSIGFFLGDSPPAHRPVMLRLGRQDIDIPPGENEYVIEDSYRLPVDVEVQAVQPHAHYRARGVRAVARLPDGSARRLITIDDWDFNWQHLYRYVSPFWLPKGTTIAMRYVYDNSAANPRNPLHPPQRAQWGQRSADEMGDLWIQVLARTDEDATVLNRDFRPKAVREDVIGYEGLIRRDPGNAALHDDLAVLYQELGNQHDAAAHFAASAALKPHAASAHFNLGTALLLAGATHRAISALQRAIELDPRHADAHNNLGNALASSGRAADALEHYRAAIAADPRHAEAHNNVGRLLLQTNDGPGAVRHFREAVRLRPGYVNARLNLGTAVATAGDVAEAIGHYRQALLADPDHPVAHNNLGSMLIHEHRVAEAIEHLNRAIRLDPEYPDAHFNLGRALRASGDMAGAVTHLRRAAALRPGWNAPLIELAALGGLQPASPPGP